MQPAWVSTSGWTSLPDVLGHGDLARLHDEIERLRSLPEQVRRPRDKPSAGTRHVVDLDQRSAEVAALLEHPRLTAAVSSLIGDTCELIEVGWRSPQPGHGGQRLHADDVPKLDDGPDRVATAIVALCDFVAANGSTRVVPGSHRRPDLQRQSGRLERHPDEIRLTGPAGTAFVFSGHLLHSGTRNDSDADRPALQFVWRATPAVTDRRSG